MMHHWFIIVLMTRFHLRRLNYDSTHSPFRIKNWLVLDKYSVASRLWLRGHALIVRCPCDQRYQRAFLRVDFFIQSNQLTLIPIESALPVVVLFMLPWPWGLLLTLGHGWWVININLKSFFRRNGQSEPGVDVLFVQLYFATCIGSSNLNCSFNRSNNLSWCFLWMFVWKSRIQFKVYRWVLAVTFVTFSE